MRICTAGESHGKENVVILEGFPKGVPISESEVTAELRRRQAGYGRGGRMRIEADTAEIISGVRNKITLGSPIAIAIKNRDCRIFAGHDDKQPMLCVPRPAHADLAAYLKFGDTDIRNYLERSSARHTVATVAGGAVCKKLLAIFGIHTASFTVSVGRVISGLKPVSTAQIIKLTFGSGLNCIDRAQEARMMRAIDAAQKQKDTLGGIVEIWVDGVPAGLGSCMQADKRLDALIAGALMSIPAVKGVEIGMGFEYARQCGSKSHDGIRHTRSKGFYHVSNHSGGIEGGISNGEPVVARIAMKPIATLMQPLDSVNLKTRKPAKAVVERSDTCAIAACGVVAEAVMAAVISQVFLEKFSGDTVAEISRRYRK